MNSEQGKEFLAPMTVSVCRDDHFQKGNELAYCGRVTLSDVNDYFKWTHRDGERRVAEASENRRVTQE